MREVSPIACNCGKNRRLPKVSRPALVASDAGEATHVYFYAIPPEGQGDPERFLTLREARWYAQRQKGPGWTIEGRREPVDG